MLSVFGSDAQEVRSRRRSEAMQRHAVDAALRDVGLSLVVCPNVRIGQRATIWVRLALAGRDWCGGNDGSSTLAVSAVSAPDAKVSEYGKVTDVTIERVASCVIPSCTFEWNQ
jgi:hypothetical protein